ncbi:alpha/beta hydrolase family protein [Chloroflexota bacterium]
MVKTKFSFPVGYREFHKDQVYNFQLNRPYSWGTARLEDMEEAGRKINNFLDWKEEMVRLAEKAVSEGRLINAAFYYRAAEFYVLVENPEREDPEKELLYDKFSELFYKAVENEEVERFKIPYEETFLPALKISPVNDVRKGTIVMLGGFDSFIEEFYSWMRYFSDNGYEVIAFEGFGQGAALKKSGLAFNIEWEKPVETVLNYFNLDDVTLHGISMGGWYCLRAAAFEPRIKRVMASGIVLDMLQTPPLVIQGMMNFMRKHLRKFTNNMMLKQIKQGGMPAWQTSNLLYITRKRTPIEALDIMAQMNEKNLHSEMVEQDVLILTGRNDHLIPFKMHRKQVKALTNAKSVTAKVFTKEENAQNHCQIGNAALALKEMVKWLDEKSS